MEPKRLVLLLNFSCNNCREDFTHTKYNAKPERYLPCLIVAYLKMLVPLLKAVLTDGLRVTF